MTFLWWATNWMLHTWKFCNWNHFDEEFIWHNLRSERFSFIHIFWDHQTVWSTLRYVNLDVICWYFLSKTSWKVPVMKLNIKNLIFTTKTNWQVSRTFSTKNKSWQVFENIVILVVTWDWLAGIQTLVPACL